MNKISWAVLGLMSIILATVAHADDVTDAVNQALEQYKAGNFTEAAGSLDYAAALVRQKKGGELQGMLPAALPGWQFEDSEVSAAGAAMFGGGISVERRYYVEDGDKNISITIVADSPMLQGIMMMFSNPMMMGGSGGKMETIAGQRALTKYEKEYNSGEITIPVANRFLVTISGDQVSMDEMKAYAAAIDYRKLASMP